jgi:hypothetical protein
LSRIIQCIAESSVFIEIFLYSAPLAAQTPRAVNIIVKYDQEAPMPARGLENGSQGACKNVFLAESTVSGLSWLNSSTGFINWQAIALATACQEKVPGSLRMSEWTNNLCLAENTSLRLVPMDSSINLILLDIPKVTYDMNGKTIICNGRIDPLINTALGCFPTCRWE